MELTKSEFLDEVLDIMYKMAEPHAEGLVELTELDGDTVYVNPLNVETVQKNRNVRRGSVLNFAAGWSLLVQENPDEVASKVVMRGEL